MTNENRLQEDHDSPLPGWVLEAVHGNYAERPFASPPRQKRVWAYTDQLSYAHGQSVALSVNTNAETFSVRIYRDGLLQKEVLRIDGQDGHWRDTPTDCSIHGCEWPVSCRIEVDDSWDSGAYVVETTAVEDGVGVDRHDHLFIVRPRQGETRSARLLLIAATSTWTAYNDWGGSNYYQGYYGPGGNRPAPVVSIHRPLARGLVHLPSDAPRAVLSTSPALNTEPRYPHMEWAYKNNHSKKYASAGWANYDRHFVAWAEAQGFVVDIISQTDLHYRPELIEGYQCVVMVGHDEYWSWQMRDAIDNYVERGGNAARFAGNFMWQIRMEDQGGRQTCYKYVARAEDPFMQSGPRHLVTESWEAKELGRPGSTTFGLDATRGMYAGWAGCSPRGPNGFSIYRPEHWAFADTGFYYGDLLGAESRAFGYEVDGLDYEVRGGLPFPVKSNDVPQSLEILAMGLASTIEEGPTIIPGRAYLGDEDALYVASVLEGNSGAMAVERTKRSSGMMVSFRRGAGQVFHAGSCEWVAGLLLPDAGVRKVTKNVLERFLS